MNQCSNINSKKINFRFKSSLSLLLLVSCFAAGQNLSPASRTTPIMTNLLNGMPIVRPPSNVVGNIYYDERWRMSSFTLYENKETIEGYPIRYNIYFDELDVNTNTGERALESSRVKSFVLRDSIITNSFTNAREYTLDEVPLKGFLEVLVDGQVQLLKRFYLIVKDPDYNPAIGSGSRDTRILTHSDLYYARENKMFEIKGKKKLFASFGDKAAEVESFMKTNSVTASTQEGMVKIFTFYNSLLK